MLVYIKVTIEPSGFTTFERLGKLDIAPNEYISPGVDYIKVDSYNDTVEETSQDDKGNWIGWHKIAPATGNGR